MDSSSTVSGRWKICAFASLLCSLLLLFTLNRGSDTVNLSTVVENVAMVEDTHNNSSTDQIAAASSIQLTKKQPKSSSDHVSTATIKDTEKCNIFDGKWVYDPIASPAYNGKQCPFLGEQVICHINGRPDYEYEKWRWQANGCQIPRFNGTDMLERLKGKRLIVVGDSINRNMWESLVCLLYSSVAPFTATVQASSGSYKVFRSKEYNCSVEFHWSPFLVHLKADEAEEGAKVLILDEIAPEAKLWRGADIMVFNSGHWWVHRGKIKAWNKMQYGENVVEDMEIGTALEMGLKTWSQWLDKNVDRNRTKVYFRSISPGHKAYHQLCYYETKPIMNDSYTPTFPKSIVDTVERTLGGMASPVRYLNITKLSQHRIDAHPAVFSVRNKNRAKEAADSSSDRETVEANADCNHWCLPGVPDTWNSLLYASMVLDESIDTMNISH